MGQSLKKHPGGRPTDYREEYNEIARKACLLGHTDKELAKLLNTSEPTLNAWKQNYPEFLKSIQDGKDNADMAVVESLYHKAIGHNQPAETKAIQFWLMNRRRDKWTDSHDKQGVSVNVIINDQPVSVEVSDDSLTIDHE